MKLVYFASVREAIGLSSEDRDIPCDARTVGDFVIWLRGQSQEHAVALDDLSRLRFALDQNMVTADALLGDGEELAIFPPVTGGGKRCASAAPQLRLRRSYRLFQG